MLQSRNLDDQRYSDLVDHAVGRLPQLCPQWTNHNPSDPGITLLELMAWYKEMQQYHMNCYTGEMKRKLLKLAGGDLRPAAAAQCGVRPLGEASGRYPALSRLETPEGVAFELLEEIGAQRPSIAECWVEDEEGYTPVSSMLERGETGIQPFAFGAREGTAFLIALDALPPRPLRLWFQVGESGLPQRNPFGSADQVPRTIRWSWEGAGEARVISDETHALSQSGYMTFAVPEELEKTSPGEGMEECWYLRADLEDPGCEETVSLSAVLADRYRAAQQETWSHCRELTVAAQAECLALFDDALAAEGAFTVFLRTGEGWRQQNAQEVRTEDGRGGVALDAAEAAEDGEPNLRVVCADPIHYADLFRPSTGLPDMTITLDLGGRQALPDRFRLICDTLQEDGSVRPEVWHCVEDLYASGPRDRVFLYDPESETISFGNGRNGAIVPRGEAAIFLASLVLSACGAGNIPEGERLSFVEDGAPVWSTAAAGGSHRESVSDAAARFLRRLEHPHKCVSAQDYEEEARRTPGLRVASARAIPGYDPLEPTGRSRHPVVTVVVIPANQQARPMPDERFLAAVRGHIDKRRPIGTVVRVMAPRYVGISVSAQLRTSGPVDEKALRQSLEEYLAVRPSGRSIGDAVVLHEMSMALQRLPEVLAVSRLELRADSAGCTVTGTGDIELPRNAVAYLKDSTVYVR